jgi:serine O-acetyltransferase
MLRSTDAHTGELAKAAAGVSAEIPDWRRERPRRFWDPGRKLLLTISVINIGQASAAAFRPGK